MSGRSREEYHLFKNPETLDAYLEACEYEAPVVPPPSAKPSLYATMEARGLFPSPEDILIDREEG